MNHEPDYIFLDRYIAGEGTTAERERVERWLAADASRAELVDWLRGVTAAARRLPAPWDPEALWRGVERRLDQPEPAAARAHRTPAFDAMLPPTGSSWSTHLLRVAAVVALAIGSVALWRLATKHAPDAMPVAMRTFSTQPGERAEFSLPDGSRVTLGVSSGLDVPETYDRRTRDVYLRGQAYFEVASNPGKPFRVHSAGAVTQVLGTKFDVRAYREDSAVAVVVAEGRVSLAARDSTGGGVVLSRGDLGRLEPNGRMRVEHGVDLDRHLAWIQGRLEFVNAPLGEVLPELARWYDLDFRLADPALATRPLTASLGTESAAEMLRLLEASLDVHVQRAGRVVTLQPQPGR